MPGSTNENIPMSARVREFDPTGDIVRVAASIATIVALTFNTSPTPPLPGAAPATTAASPPPG